MDQAKQSGKIEGEKISDVSSTAGAAGNGTKGAVSRLGAAAGRVVEAVESGCDEVGKAARLSFKHGRARARRWETNFESTVCERPYASLLAAAGVGLLVGLLLNARRR